MLTSPWVLISLSIIAYLAYKLFLLPQYRMLYYTKQGMKQHFFAPLLGFLYYLIRDQKGKQKDCLYSLRHLPEQFKDKKVDAFVSNIGSSPLIHLLDANLIGDFLQKQAEHYKKTDFATKMSKLLFGKGIIFAEGDEWKAKRKLLSNSFHFKIIEDQVKLVTQVTERTISQQNLSDFCFLTTIEKIGGDVGLMSFLGADVNNYTLFGMEPTTGINHYMNEAIAYMMNPLTVLMGDFMLNKKVRASDRSVIKGSQEIKNLLRQIVVDRIKVTKEELAQLKDKEVQSMQTTIISIMLQNGQLKDEEEIEELVVLTLNFYFAAKDTVSRSLANLFYYIGKNEYVYDLLEKEILSFAHEEVTNDSLKKYTYLEAVIKESLRIGGPTPFLIQRTALSDHKIGNYTIKKDTEVNCNFMYNYYNEKYFENPMEFNPERWIDPKQYEKSKANPFAYLPFSGGSRNCIGQYFAMMEMKAIVIYFIRTFEKFKIPEDFVFHLIVKSTIETKDHLKVSLQKRINSK